MFRFASPEYLYLLLIIPVLVLIAIASSVARRKKLAKIVDPSLKEVLIPNSSGIKSGLAFTFTLLGIACIAVALAQPQFGTKMEEVKAVGSDIIIAIDVSNSMMAEDLPPNRLERAKNSVEKLIGELKGDRVGIVAFAGKSFLQLPLTTDYSAARMMLSYLSPDLINTQGTAIGAAIETAIEAFPEEGEAGRTLVVITDGENHEDNAIAAAEAAADQGISVFTIGMGKPEGAPIPVQGRPNTYIKDSEGNTVITKLDENALIQIASEGGGDFVRVSGGTPDLAAIIEGVEGKDQAEFGSKKFTEYEDRYQLPLLLGILLLMIEPVMGNTRGSLSRFFTQVTEKGV